MHEDVGYHAGSDSAVPTPDRPDESRSPAGHADVDAALRLLDGLGGRPVTEHVEVFQSVHARLEAALSESRQPPSGSA